jgi:hypothetical protein
VSRFHVAILAPSLAALACGSSATSSGGADAGADAGGAADSGGPPTDAASLSDGDAHADAGTGGACSAPADTASAIVATCDAHAQQTATGGTIVQGSYFASSDVVLQATPCSSAYVPSTTLQIANGVFSFSFAPAPGLGEEHQQWSYVASGSQVTLTLLCDTDPNGSVGSVVVAGYSTLVSQLTLYFPACCGGSYPGENVSFSPM